MFLLPFSDNNPTRRFPVMTTAIIFINVVVFFMTWHGDFNASIEKYAFVPAEPTLLTLVSHQFLHGGYMHLIGNMWFLWLFGDNIEDLVGRIAFVPFYLICGFCAAGLHSLVSGSGPGSEIPTVGASGAIAGMLGSYFVIFSKSRIKCLLLFVVFPLGMVQVPSLFFLGLKIALDIVFGLLPMGMLRVSIAHWAHIGGFIFGAGVLQLLISTRAVIVPNLDRVRRGEFATMEEEERFIGRLDAALEKKSFSKIPEEYRNLLKVYPTLIFSPERQMQVARAVKAAGDLPLAADAYRKVMDCYPGHPMAHRAGIEVAKIAAGFFRDRRMAVSYLDWVVKAAGSGPLAVEATNMAAKIRSGGAT